MADVLNSSPSPTFSAAARSPSQPAFHAHAHARPYHVARRVSSEFRSPRLHHSVSDLRRPPARADTITTSTTTSTTNSSSSAAPSPFPSSSSTARPLQQAAVASSPHLRLVQTADAGTQYTPPDLPPTAARQAARPARQQPGSTTAPLGRETAKRRASSPSAEAVATDPPEPDPRLDPQPSSPSSSSKNDVNGAQQINGPVAVPAATRPPPAASGVESSAAKRARPPEPAEKVMPIKYETCDVKDLGMLISDMLMELVRLNDGIPLKDGQLTRFHSRAPPGISVRDYLNRLIVHATLSPPILLSMVYYIDRLCVLYPVFTISSLTVHRFLISAATVAAKGLSDSFWTNGTYARVGGVSVRELALLELELLEKLEWRIVPKPEVLVDYYRSLVERSEGFVLEREDLKGTETL